MLELPLTWRTLLVESLENYCDTLDETSEPDDVAEAVIEQAEAISEQISGVEAEGIVSLMEEGMEDDAGSLIEELVEAVREMDDDVSGELLMRAIERLTEIEYTEDGDDDEAGGFFDAGASLDEDF